MHTTTATRTTTTTGRVWSGSDWLSLALDKFFALRSTHTPSTHLSSPSFSPLHTHGQCVEQMACQTDSQLNWYKNTKFTQICAASSTIPLASSPLPFLFLCPPCLCWPVKRVSYLHLSKQASQPAKRPSNCLSVAVRVALNSKPTRKYTRCGTYSL